MNTITVLILYSHLTGWQPFYESKSIDRVNRFVKMWGSQRPGSVILICNYERVIFSGKAGEFK